MATSSVLGNLGMLHVVTGTVNASQGTDATLSSNDASATLARDGTGQYTVTFGQAFMSAPVIVAQTVDATFATTAAHTASVLASASGTAQFDIVTTTTNGTATDILSALADIDFGFVAIGLRDK